MLSAAGIFIFDVEFLNCHCDCSYFRQHSSESAVRCIDDTVTGDAIELSSHLVLDSDGSYN